MRVRLALSPLLLVLHLAPVSARLAGFHVDIESCDGDVNDGQNRSAELALCNTFFGTLANISATLRRANLLLAGAEPFILSVDGGTSWSCPEDDGSTACYSVPWAGKNKSVAQHVLDIADEVVLMDYDTNPTEVLSRARRYLDYADSLGKNGSVRVGLWLAGWNETGAAYNPGDMSRDEADLEAEMAGLRAQLAVHPSFKDFAVFTDSGGPGSPTPSDLEPWKDQSVRKPSRGPFSRAGQWYIDHAMVLNATERALWLTWARSRKLDSVWIAPHATDVDLIEIPGVEGSHADEVAFCDFIREADMVGVDVQLFASPMALAGSGADELDLRFAINCTKSLPPPAPRPPPPAPPPADIPLFLPTQGPVYIYASRDEAAAACSNRSLVLCGKAALEGHEKCAAGWCSDWVGYWMAEATAGCGAAGYNEGSGPAGAYCCAHATAFPCSTVSECVATPMWHIPGPNPIVSPAGSNEWMSQECEVAGGVFQDADGKYYFIYHCDDGDAAGYQVGMSTADHPLGPWTMPPPQPNLAVSTGQWDEQVVASFNILPDPEKPGAWLGFYEGGMGNGTDGKWSMGVARAPHPLGPWSKSAANPVLAGNRTCDKKREFYGGCGGLYVAAAMHGPHTGGEYWVYLEAPINPNDEGPIALWSAPKPEGPWAFKAYVMDGGLHTGAWDSGRYSESRVWYHGGLFHLFATASAHGQPACDKVNEQIGWMVSADGVHFVEHADNPLARFNQSTPHTQAMAEGHVWIDDAEQLVYTFHTIRWDNGMKHTAFAPNGRNAEDLGVEIFSKSPRLNFSFPVITPNWKLDLAPGDESRCRYDAAKYRYCAQLKTLLRSSSSSKVLRPTLSFSVQAKCGDDEAAASASATLSVYSYSSAQDAVGRKIATLPLSGGCVGGAFTGTTTARSFAADALWVVTTVSNTGGTSLHGVRASAHYHNTEAVDS